MSRIDGPHHHHHHHHVGEHHHTQGPRTEQPRPPPPPGPKDGNDFPRPFPGHFTPDPQFPQGHHCWDTLPPPAPEQSSPPAGAGLTTGSDNPFGPNAITTAGGYTIVPTGKDQAWDIYAPGQKPGDTPNTHIWGDPHVNEKDGTRWDFTRNSNFRLPDGTNISVNTVPYNGDESHRLTSTLDITCGADHVVVSGIDQNKPSVGEIKHDGFYARADLAAGEDTFTLGGTGDDVKWFKSVDGHNQGEVTGAAMVTQADGTAAYEQNVKAGDYVVDPSLQPKVGSAAWGDALRDQAVDTARGMFGSKTIGAELSAAAASIDHTANTPEGKQFTAFMKQLENMFGLMRFMETLTSPRAQGFNAR